MKMKLLTVALLSALGLAGCGNDDDDPIATVRSVEFTGIPRPAPIRNAPAPTPPPA